MFDATALGPDGTSVYLYYDKHDVLIYVGVTSRGTRRQHEHNGDKDWWPLVDQQMVEHYPTREKALARETYLIGRYRPPFNTAQNPSAKNSRRAYEDGISTLREMTPARRLKTVQGRVPLRIAKRDGQTVTLVAGTRFAALMNKTDLHRDKTQVMGWQIECGRVTAVAKHAFATVFEVCLNDAVELIPEPYAQVDEQGGRFVCRFIKVQRGD